MILLIWNAKFSKTWSNREHDLEAFQGTGELEMRWSCGTSRNIPVGTRAFLMRLGAEPKGLIGSGITLTAPARGEHWDEVKANEGKQALYVPVKFDVLSDLPLISLAELNEAPFNAHRNWTPQAGGTRVTESIQAELESLWSARSSSERYDEIPEIMGEGLWEGAKKRIYVDSFERNPAARAACVKEFGKHCFVCSFSFQDVYGDYAADFIHVHHITPLSQISKSYVVNPKQHLRPLCPNCHAAIHLRKPTLTPEEFRDEFNGRRGRGSS